MTKLRPVASLKAAVTRLIELAGGSEAHQGTRVSRSVMHSYGDPASGARHIPLDLVIVLEKRIGNPVCTAFSAMEQGYALLPMHGRHSGEPYPLALARITSQTGELLSAGAQAIRDGRVSLGEARLIKNEAMDVGSAIAALIADCDAVIERGDL